MQRNKKKIINDPLYGFISIPTELIFDIIEHPYFRRLSRIRQLGLTHMVYPGAIHSRFNHALGALHLMSNAIEVLRSKGHDISFEEAEGACIAILLHDIGHSPFSHALEHSIVTGIRHEALSLLFMQHLNSVFDGRLSTAIEIFQNKYPKKFLHQLISGQLDVDRLDYLNRDSFYTGVQEGIVGSERIIKMLNVYDDNLVVDEKGIISVEKFIVSRIGMYWQVYLHKTVLAAEFLLVNILKRARELCGKGQKLFCTPVFRFFLENSFDASDFRNNPQVLKNFSRLDDFDIMAGIKVWVDHPDLILSELCKCLINRNLYKSELQTEKFDALKIKKLKELTMSRFKIKEEEVPYFLVHELISNEAYDQASQNILILLKSQRVSDITEVSHHINLSALNSRIEKHLLCFHRNLE